MEPPYTIAKPLPALRNFSANQIKGRWAEQEASSYFQKRKYFLIAQRKKLKYGEIDLVFKFKNEVLFVEVKYLHNPWMVFQRLHNRQKHKIWKNVLFYQRLNPRVRIKPVLCLVNRKKQVVVIDL